MSWLSWVIPFAVPCFNCYMYVHVCTCKYVRCKVRIQTIWEFRYIKLRLALRAKSLEDILAQSTDLRRRGPTSLSSHTVWCVYACMRVQNVYGPSIASSYTVCSACSLPAWTVDPNSRRILVSITHAHHTHSHASQSQSIYQPPWYLSLG